MNKTSRSFNSSFFHLPIIMMLVLSAFELKAQTLYWDVNGATAGSGATGVSGAGPGNWTSDSFWTADSAGNSATTGWIDGRPVVFSAGADGAGSWAVTITGTIRTPSIEFQEAAITTIRGGTIDVTGGFSITNVSGAAGDKDDIQSVLSGTGDLTLALNGIATSGSNWTRLSGINTFIGSTTVTRGVLQIYNANAADAQKALGNANNILILNGGTLMNDNQNISLDATRSIQIGANGGTLRVYGGRVMTVNGVISGGNLLKSDSGTLVLTGNNTYTGTTTVRSGILQIGNGGTTGTLGTGTVEIWDTVESSMTLSINRSDTYVVNNLIKGRANGAGILRIEGSGTIVLTSNNTYGATVVTNGILQIGNGGANGSLGFDASSVSLASGTKLVYNMSDFNGVNNVISGAGEVVVNMTGTGSVALLGANTYSGGTTVSAGTLRGTTDANFGATTSGITLDGGILMNNDSFLALDAARVITLGAAGGGFKVGWAKTLTVNGKITGVGELRVNNDSGTLILAGTTSDYTGNTTIGVATGSTTLRLGASGVLPDSTNVRFNAGGANTATLDLNGQTETVGGLVSVAGNGVINNSSTTKATITAGPQSGSATYSGLISDGAGVVAVGKTGAGTQEFTGDNTYTGGTTISQGTLLANNFPGSGSALGTGSVLVTSGGRLGGTGSVFPGNGASITVTAGKLMVGNTHGVSVSNGGFGAEKLILGSADLNVSISLNGTLQFDIVGAGSMLDVGDAGYSFMEGANDTLKISTNGTLNLDNAIIELAVEDTSSWDEGQTWKLIDWSGSMPSSFSAQNLQLLTNNIAGFNIIQHIVESGEGAGYYITLAAVPEPSRMMLLIIAVAGLALRRSRTGVVR